MRILFLIISALLFGNSFAQVNGASKKSEKLLNEAASFYNNQKYVKALNLSKQALSISLSNNDEYHLALSYNLIGTIYNDFSQKDRALNYYSKGLAYANKVDNDTLRLWLNSNIGSFYYYNDIDLHESIRFYEKSLNLAEKIKDSLQITLIRLNIANAYFEVDNAEAGFACIEPLRSYIEKSKNVESRISYNDLLGKYHSLKGRNKEAAHYFLKAIRLAKEYKSMIQLRDVYQNFSQHYSQIGNLNQSELYKKLAKKLEVDVHSEEKLDSIEKVAMQIELDEYKFQFEKIELSNELQIQKIREGRILIVAFIVIMVILLILLFTLSRNNKIRKQINNALYRSNQELTEAKNRAEENSILKSQFISTVSHELRTPLYGVIGLTNIILEENKEIVSQENLHSLRFSAQYLLALVNDLLEINKAEEQKIILKKIPFNLKREVEIINNSLAFMAEANGNNLCINVDETIPQTLVGDELRLSQILMNLISNGLKFTEAGEVKIEAKLLSIEESTCSIKFVVSDTGIGIKEEDQQKIFEKFVQIERKKGDYQGTGLGLPIVKKLVELFGGTIEVESQQNKGTTFTFNLTFEYLKAVPSITISKPINIIMERKLHFLVVEDNKINQIVTKKIIERKDYQCTIVENGLEAIEILKTASFDMILMDINMPQLDGYETSKVIRDNGITTPIIALTAFELAEVEEKAKLFGINDVIIKPFTSDNFFEIIEKILLSEDGEL